MIIDVLERYICMYGMFIFVTTFVTRFVLLHFFIFISLLNIELVDFVYFYKILFIITMIRDIETIS